MSTTTTNYGLIKPDTTDPILIGQLNDNADAIDAALKENADAIENKPDAADIPAPSTTAPAMDGTGSAGTSSQYARADHVHPSDTSKQNALSSTQLDAVNSGIDSTKVAQIETNKNNILSLEQMNGAKNKFNYDAWKNCGVFQGTKTINGNSFTIVASGEDCFTYYENNEPRQYPINARIPCNAGDKVVFTWDYTPLSGQSNDRVAIFANGLASTGFFIMTAASNKKLEFTAPTGTTYLSIRFGVLTSGNSATYGNIQIQSKASYDAGFTDYQPYALSNAELTAAIQALQAQLNQ